jgi:formamidopyrimidine-DNA glycosylase
MKGAAWVSYSTSKRIAAPDQPGAANFILPMPELPEVETIVRSLRNPADWPFAAAQSLRQRPGVIGRQITSADLLWQRTLAFPEPEEFLCQIQGRTIRDVKRRGKFVVLLLNEGYLLTHLRMSGDLRVDEGNADLLTHDRLVLNFADAARLIFNDTRKFGRVWLVKDMDQVTGGLGPEPLDAGLNADSMYERWHRSGRAIKTLLLDQSLLAGVGNIYSDEALFLAKLHPQRPGNSLSLEESGRLLQAVRVVLEEGIRRNGASIDWVYRGGDFQNYFKVYQRTGEACTVCGTPIERLIIGQRSSHFCPHCQRI